MGHDQTWPRCFVDFLPPSARHAEEYGHPYRSLFTITPLGFLPISFFHLGLILWAVILNFLPVSRSLRACLYVCFIARGLIAKNGLFPIPRYQRWIMPQKICILCVTCSFQTPITPGLSSLFLLRQYVYSEVPELGTALFLTPRARSETPCPLPPVCVCSWPSDRPESVQPITIRTKDEGTGCRLGHLISLPSYSDNDCGISLHVVSRGWRDVFLLSLDIR